VLKRQKNQIYEALEAAEMQPSQFHAGDMILENMAGFGVEMKNTPLTFIFRTSEHSFEKGDCRFTLAAAGWPLGDWWPGKSFGEFSVLVYRFSEWLGTTVQLYLEDQEAVDLWTQVVSETDVLTASLDDPKRDQQFSKQEKALLRESVSRVRKRIKETFLPKQKVLNEINRRLDYLEQAVDRLSRFDWKNLLISTIMAIGVNLSVDKTTGGQLMELFKHAFSQAIYLLK
jgi:hypothetical protein